MLKRVWKSYNLCKTTLDIYIVTNSFGYQEAYLNGKISTLASHLYNAQRHRLEVSFEN